MKLATPARAEVKNELRYISTPLIHLNDMNRETFSFYVTKCLENKS
jgi:hypothetical protein